MSQESQRDRCLAHLETEPLFAQGRLAILDHPVLVRKLKLLERRPRASGKTFVDHPTGAHDDHANALALAAALALGGGRLPELYTFTIEPSPPPSLADVATKEEQDEADDKARDEAQALEARQQAALWGPGDHWHTLG